MYFTTFHKTAEINLFFSSNFYEVEFTILYSSIREIWIFVGKREKIYNQQKKSPKTSTLYVDCST